MKKTFAILSAILFVSFFLCQGTCANEKDFASFSNIVPENSLAYVEVHDFQKIKDDFFKLGFWKDGQNARVVLGRMFHQMAWMAKRPSSPDLMKLVERTIDNIHSFRLVFVDLDREKPSNTPSVAIQLVFADKNFIDDFLNSPIIKDKLATTYNKGGIRILSVQNNEHAGKEDFFMGVKNGAVYITTKKMLLRQVLGMAKFANKKLAAHSDFKALKNKYKNAGVWGYINLPELMSIADKHIKKDRDVFDKIINLKSFGPVSFGNWFDRGYGPSDFVITFREECPVYEQFRQEPSDMAVVKLFPRDTLVGFMLSTQNAPEAWQNFKKMLFTFQPPEKNAKMDLSISKFEQVFGFKINEITAAVKGEIGFVMFDLPFPPGAQRGMIIEDEGGAEPRRLPPPRARRRARGPMELMGGMMDKMAFLVQVSDPAKIEKMISAGLLLAEREHMAEARQPVKPLIKNENYKGITITSITQQDRPGPVVFRAWIKNVLIVGLDDKPVKKIIDSFKSGENIFSGVDKASIKDLPKKASMIFIGRPQKMLENPQLVPEEYSRFLKKNMVVYFGTQMDKNKLVSFSNTPYAMAGSLPIIAAIAIPSLLQSKIAANDTAAKNNLRALQTANQTFNTQNFGQSDSMVTKYYGYCKRSNDLITATIKDATGADVKIKGVDAALCADEGKNANANGYFYRYIVEAGDIYTDAAGVEKVNGYTICAWPETIGKTGTKYYIVNEQGTIYWRNADPAVKFPLKGWPSDEELEMDWTAIAK